MPTLQQFEAGRRSLLDLLDVENEYFQANIAYANALFDLKIAKARLSGDDRQASGPLWHLQSRAFRNRPRLASTLTRSRNRSRRPEQINVMNGSRNFRTRNRYQKKNNMRTAESVLSGGSLAVSLVLLARLQGRRISTDAVLVRPAA
jgi:hypothetical protein